MPPQRNAPRRTMETSMSRVLGSIPICGYGRNLYTEIPFVVIVNELCWPVMGAKQSVAQLGVQGRERRGGLVSAPRAARREGDEDVLGSHTQ